MPDPTWTEEYNLQSSPEVNGFTRQLDGSPVVNEVTSGNPSQRRVEIDSTNGDAIFVTSNVPAFDKTVGATLEADVQCTGTGDIGFEITFLDGVCLAMIWQDRITIEFPTGQTIPGAEYEAAGQDNSTNPVKVRLLAKPDGNFECYRDGVLILGPLPYSDAVRSFQRFLWWGEGGGTQKMRGIRYYLGGAVAPG
jgi:hypothetical protein